MSKTAECASRSMPFVPTESVLAELSDALLAALEGKGPTITSQPRVLYRTLSRLCHVNYAATTAGVSEGVVGFKPRTVLQSMIAAAREAGRVARARPLHAIDFAWGNDAKLFVDGKPSDHRPELQLDDVAFGRAGLVGLFPSRELIFATPVDAWEARRAGTLGRFCAHLAHLESFTKIPPRVSRAHHLRLDLGGRAGAGAVVPIFAGIPLIETRAFDVHTAQQLLVRASTLPSQPRSSTHEAGAALVRALEDARERFLVSEAPDVAVGSDALGRHLDAGTSLTRSLLAFCPAHEQNLLLRWPWPTAPNEGFTRLSTHGAAAALLILAAQRTSDPGGLRAEICAPSTIDAILKVFLAHQSTDREAFENHGAFLSQRQEPVWPHRDEFEGLALESDFPARARSMIEPLTTAAAAFVMCEGVRAGVVGRQRVGSQLHAALRFLAATLMDEVSLGGAAVDGGLSLAGRAAVAAIGRALDGALLAQLDVDARGPDLSGLRYAASPERLGAIVQLQATSLPPPDPTRDRDLENFKLIASHVPLDAIRDELRVHEALWTKDQNRQTRIASQAHTQTIPLRRLDRVQGVMPEDTHWTSRAGACASFPGTMALVEAFCRSVGCVVARVNLVRLAPGKEVLPHHDSGEYYVVRNRFHLVIDSPEGSLLESGGESVRMREGELWWFDNERTHRAENLGSTWRVHLIFDARPESLSFPPDVARIMRAQRAARGAKSAPPIRASKEV